MCVSSLLPDSAAMSPVHNGLLASEIISPNKVSSNLLLVMVFEHQSIKGTNMADQSVSARDLPVFGFLEPQEHTSIPGFLCGL